MKRKSLLFNHGIKRSMPKKITMITGIALILLFAGATGSYASNSGDLNNESNTLLQVTEVTGVVTDNEGVPLPGVSILIKGTTVGAVSDLNGSYRLEIPSGSSQPVVLVYSFIGFKVHEIAVGNQTSIDVTLEVEFFVLVEVVVVVYGSTSPDFTPPLGEQVRSVRLGLDCSPCFERTCPLEHSNCMNELKPKLLSISKKSCC